MWNFSSGKTTGNGIDIDLFSDSTVKKESNPFGFGSNNTQHNQKTAQTNGNADFDLFGAAPFQGNKNFGNLQKSKNVNQNDEFDLLG